MTANETGSARGRCGECDLIAAILHDMSQPLTALEVGLEISLRQDRNVAQRRSRVESSLEIAQSLHQKLAEFQGSGTQRVVDAVGKVRTASRGLVRKAGKSCPSPATGVRDDKSKEPAGVTEVIP